MSERILEWKRKFQGPRESVLDLPLPDIWQVAGYVLTLFFLIIVSVPLIILALVSGAVRLFFAVLIVLIAGMLISSYVFKLSYSPTSWERGKEVSFLCGQLDETAVCVERAMLGMTYSQHVLKERLRNIMFEKIEMKLGLDEGQVRELGEGGVASLLNSNVLAAFLLTPETAPKGRKWWRKRDKAEWKRIKNLMREVESWA